MASHRDNSILSNLLLFVNMMYVVATPIGNLEDISLRALRILKEVDLILCEDTRVTKKLLDKYQIKTPTTSYHQHSKLKKTEYILKQLETKNLALVSDAGTPTISDPGAKLISYLKKQNVDIVSVPGPSALISALSISGIPADKFFFMGFPPVKKKRKKFFQEAADSKYTVVFYESPHRIEKTLKELESVSDKEVVVCKELTKKFEKCYSGDNVLEKMDKVKGEFVVILKGGKG